MRPQNPSRWYHKHNAGSSHCVLNCGTAGKFCAIDILCTACYVTWEIDRQTRLCMGQSIATYVSIFFVPRTKRKLATAFNWTDRQIKNTNWL